MKKKNRSKKTSGAENDDEIAHERRVSGEALRGVSAVFFVATATFLILAPFDIAGKAGSLLYTYLSWLLGVGYFLLPLSLVLLAVLIFKSFEKSFGVIQLASMFVFLLSGLGMINLAFPGDGGVLGAAVTKPMVATIDTAATVIFLVAFTIASLVLAFDIHLGAVLVSLQERLRGIRKTGDVSDDISLAPVIGLPEGIGITEDESLRDQSGESAAPSPDTKALGTDKLWPKKDSGDGFSVILATGSAYTPPPLSILSKNRGKPEVGDVKANMNIIKRTLQNFGIQVEMDEASIGPTVTRYAMKPAEGVRLSKIVALQSNLELALAASPLRIEAPIPGKSLVGVEVPNISRTTLGLAPLLSDTAFVQSDKPLLLSLGRSITGMPHFADLARMPHILVAGATGAGKSVTIHNFIVSMLYRCGPERLRFIMIDPKRVELTVYNSIPHLLTPVITDAKKAILAIKWLAKEMERRYNILETEAVRDIASYHQNVVAPALEKAAKKGSEQALPEAMPYIVVIIDELADMMSAYPRELESGVVRLAQMSRAVGIHLILSTQRPSVKVITGLIKANIPARVALQVASQIDSRTILDTGGAEKLLGAGDTLFLSGEMSKPRRIQAPFTSEAEVKRVVAHIAAGSEGILPSEIDFSETRNDTDSLFSSMIESDGDDDALYGEAKQAVVEAGKASTSYLQRKLRVGYARAARLIDLLEERGVIGPGDGARPREIIGLPAGRQALDNADELVATAEKEDGFDERL
ncbi:MAG: Cell division FtsK/SpoIIIE [Parcubacteria group bacterium GW2011_GWA2_51_10]|nr:MAG: Cell division FtsK/SpoIIIE [Parcubacteria group bacterium GW2011_GWA2_51_10]